MIPQENTHGLVIESQLNELLSNLLDALPDLLAAIIADLDGLVIAHQSREEVDETVIGAVMGAIDQTIKRIKTSTEVSLGSGIFDTDKFQIVFIKIEGISPTLFVMVADLLSNIDLFVPYSYLIAEKISLILHNRETSLNIPIFKSNGQIDNVTRVDRTNRTETIIQLLVLGDVEVGKSTLMDLYVNGKVETSYKPTIGISILTQKLQITREISLTYQIFDMSGAKSLAKVRKIYYLQLFPQNGREKSRSAAILVVFDCTKPETLKNAEYWIRESRKFIGDTSVHYILIANKIDLLEDRGLIQKKAKIIAEKFNCSYAETSAITGEGLDEVFTLLATKFS